MSKKGQFNRALHGFDDSSVQIVKIYIHLKPLAKAFFTARTRNLRRLCQQRGLSRPLSGVSLSRVGLCPGESLFRGVSVRGVSVQGGLCPGVLCPGGSLSWRPPPTVTSRQYASYWNAFLLTVRFIQDR